VVRPLFLGGHKVDALAAEPGIDEDRHRLWPALEDAKAAHDFPFLLFLPPPGSSAPAVQVGAPAADQGPVAFGRGARCPRARPRPTVRARLPPAERRRPG
jgi:hypothetical protein